MTGTCTCPTGTGRSLIPMIGGGCSGLDGFEEVEVGAVLVGSVLPASASTMAVMAGFLVLPPTGALSVGGGVSIGTIVGLPPASCVLPGLGLPSGLVFSVCCGRLGYSCFPASYVLNTCWKALNSC